MPEYKVSCVVVHRFENGISDFDGFDYCVRDVAKPLFKFIYLIKQVLWLRRIKRDFAPDITISTLGSCSVINVLSGGKGKKIGIFHSPHTQEKEKGFIVYSSTIFAYRYIFTKLDRLICVSLEIKRSILNSFPAYARKDLKVAYNIHDFDSILEKSKISLTTDLLKLVNSNTIVYIGRLDRNKAPDRAIKAFELAIDLLPPNANIIFIGNSNKDLLKELKQYVVSRNLDDKVFFCGYQSNPYNILLKSRCLISSSYSEGLPGVIIESLFLGKPVVTTNSSEGIWEIFSCQESYSKRMKGLYVSQVGVISQNLSAHNQKEYLKDVEYLASGIVEAFQINFQNFDFNIKFNKKTIIETIIA